MSPLSEQPPHADTAPRQIHAIEADQIAQSLNVDISRGLNLDEANERLKHEGSNSLPSTETRWPEVLVRQFSDILISILVVAATISIAVGHVADAITIFIIVLFNALSCSTPCLVFPRVEDRACLAVAS